MIAVWSYCVLILAESGIFGGGIAAKIERNKILASCILLPIVIRGSQLLNVRCTRLQGMRVGAVNCLPGRSSTQHVCSVRLRRGSAVCTANRTVCLCRYGTQYRARLRRCSPSARSQSCLCFALLIAATCVAADRAPHADRLLTSARSAATRTAATADWPVSPSLFFCNECCCNNTDTGNRTLQLLYLSLFNHHFSILPKLPL